MGYGDEVGSKYEQTKSMSKAEIAKLIRADLKSAFPGIKFSVRTSHFSGGGSIDIEIKSLPAGMRVRNPDNRHPVTGQHQWMTDEAIALEKGIKAVADAYNFDHSDLMADYFHVRFYCEVKFSRELTEQPAAPVLALVPAPAPSETEECEARWTALLSR